MNYTEKNKLIDSLCGIGLMLVLAEMFLGIADSSFTVFNYNLTSVTTGVHIFGILFLIISVCVLIRAYKKDNMTTGIYGLELLALAISAALLPASYLEFSYPFNKLNKILPIAFFVYYIMKLIVVLIKTRKNTSKGKKK